MTNNLWTSGMPRRDILLTINLPQTHQLVDFESKPWERLKNIANHFKYKLIELDQYYDCRIIDYFRMLRTYSGRSE